MNARHNQTKGRATAVAAVLLGLLFLGLAALPASADAKRGAAKVAGTGPLRGVNLTPMQAFMPGGQSDVDNQREVQSACQMGADVVRVFVMWYRLEPSRGQLNADYVAKLDSLMSQASACGTRVMFMLAATPEWDSSAPAGTLSPNSGTYAPRDGEFRWMVAWILRRWPALQSLEVWNEPNLPPYWSGTPADYAGMVNAAVAAKQEVGSSTLILAGALASGAVDYLNRLYAAGMSGQDGISLHPYSMYCTVVCLLTDPSPPEAPFRAAITRIHDVMVARGDRSGLWLTEFGFASCPALPTCVSESQQAQWIVKSIRIASCYPYVKGLVPFTIRDIPGDPLFGQIFDAHFGLLRTDFSPKPSYSAVASAYRRYNSAERRASAKRTRSRKAIKAAAMPGSQKCQTLLGVPSSATKQAKRR
jgi:cellulase (glycosyl hydrolase family 5)